MMLEQWSLEVSLRIGVDLGGTKIEAIALADDGHEAGRLRTPTPRDDYTGTLAAIAQAVEDLERDLGKRGSVKPETRNRCLALHVPVT